MKKLLIMIDCLRYDHSDVFDFKGFTKLNNIVSVSNWTRPVIASLLTGKTPQEHGAILKSLEGLQMNGGYKFKKREVQYLNCVEQGRIGSLKSEMLTEKYDSNVFMELPVYQTLKQGVNGEFCIAGEMGAVKRMEQELGNKEFMFVHLKGGHSPFEYKNLGITLEGYKLELEELAKNLVPVVEQAKKYYGRIAIVADHGRIWDDIDGKEASHPDTYNNAGGWMHGGTFHISNLHVPAWLWSKDGINVEDALYDSRMIYRFLEDEPILRQEFVVSSAPAYYDYNRLAITYLHNGKLISENYQTKEGWDQ